ncbi:DUF6013 family protein [Paraburkholderia sp. DHOC27]|uniref:DUF6013 family protein n=1 Tax=Paraburkholderia sp. DHOC27 TaxID=2303330 RepID=UPI000E3B8D64|nr:DUF6013 family protein [Paraburkholderia sp. DHOC27]RFU47783.1 hypothetical protein D0B32_09570 [Paraburkholderia sp. DHOC27]
MSPCFSLSANAATGRVRRPVIASLLVAFAALVATATPLGAVYAATPITVTSQAATDGPIRYTVKVTSKQFGNAQETRTIRSGESDDFTWKTVPPGGAVMASDQCPDYASLPLDTNGAMIRQTQIRFAPVVSNDGTATVQLSFQAQTPHGSKSVDNAGKTVQCPNNTKASEIVRFSMPTNGSTKTLTLTDGTQIAVSAKR